MSTEEFCLPKRKFSPLKKNSTAKMNTFTHALAAQFWRKLPASSMVTSLLGDGLVECVMAWHDRDTFLRTVGRRAENKWCGLSKHAGRSNFASGGYDLQRCTG